MPAKDSRQTILIKQAILSDDLKFCCKCNRILSIRCFSKQSRARDGLHSHCNPCNREGVALWRKRNSGYIKKYYLKKRVKKLRMANLIKYKNKNKDKIKAWTKFRWELSQGRIKKPDSCSACGMYTRSRNLHGHHSDYSKPCDVIWLCNICHTNLHCRRA